MPIHTGIRSALGFLARSGRNQGASVRRAEQTLTLPDGERMPCDVYTPKGPATRGPVLFVHGMTWRGHRDPRMMAASEALAVTGRRVFTPRFPDILDMRIRLETVTRIADAARQLAEVEGRRVGLASVSFSAGMAISAAADPRARDHVASVLSIGAFTDATRAVRFLLTSPDADPYGRLVVLRDRLPQVREVSPGLRAALFGALQDQGFDPGEPRLPALREALSEADRRLLDLCLGPPERMSALNAELIAALGPEFEAFTITPAVAEALRARICLLHGAGDRVIPPSESVQLHALLRAAGRESWLALTSLIGHGHATPDLRAIASVPPLVEATRAFFAALDR